MLCIIIIFINQPPQPVWNPKSPLVARQGMQGRHDSTVLLVTVFPKQNSPGFTANLPSPALRLTVAVLCSSQVWARALGPGLWIPLWQHGGQKALLQVSHPTPAQHSQLAQAGPYTSPETERPQPLRATFGQPRSGSSPVFKWKLPLGHFVPPASGPVTGQPCKEPGSALTRSPHQVFTCIHRTLPQPPLLSLPSTPGAPGPLREAHSRFVFSTKPMFAATTFQGSTRLDARRQAEAAAISAS